MTAENRLSYLKPAVLCILSNQSTGTGAPCVLVLRQVVGCMEGEEFRSHCLPAKTISNVQSDMPVERCLIPKMLVYDHSNRT